MIESTRKERILKLIVEEFIKTAEPVGSETLIDKYNLDFSSATIRNDMHDLENMGYLEKTHTSSGRVPSSSGYRYYVDFLRDDSDTQQIKNQLQTIFDTNKSITIDEAIKHSCEIISQVTNLTSVVLGPDANKERMKKIQLLEVDDHSAMAIFLTDTGHIEHNTFAIPNDVTFNDLETVVNIINDRVVGTPISQVSEKVYALKPLLAERVANFDTLFKSFVEAFLKFTYDRVSVYGRDQLFEHKEFTNDLEKMRKFVKLLESNKLFKDLDRTDGIKVKIGTENDTLDLDDVSIISANIKINDEQKGTISLVGPTRMDYNKVISAIELVQEELEKFFKEDK